MKPGSITRREGLGLAGLSAGAVATQGLAVSTKPPLVTKTDFKDPRWNRDTFIRMDADVDPAKEKCGWFRGTAFGVRENEKVRPLFKIDGFSFVRTKRLEDGSWRRLLREIAFYRDLETNEILKTWHNPYTDETVTVVPIANDPYNFTISEFYPDPPSQGGHNTEKAPPKRPYLLNWSHGPDDTLILNVDVELYFPSAMQPDEWPRESPGVFTRASEQFIYTVKRKDVENPNVTSLPLTGAWAKITPWLPWMLMGAAPGHVTYFTSIGTAFGGEKELPADLVAAARAMGEKWLHAPTTDYGPSLSSLENYKLANKPAPVPPGWTPPQPPAPPKLPPRKG